MKEDAELVGIVRQFRSLLHLKFKTIEAIFLQQENLQVLLTPEEIHFPTTNPLVGSASVGTTFSTHDCKGESMRMTYIYLEIKKCV